MKLTARAVFGGKTYTRTHGNMKIRLHEEMKHADRLFMRSLMARQIVDEDPEGVALYLEGLLPIAFSEYEEEEK